MKPSSPLSTPFSLSSLSFTLFFRSPSNKYYTYHMGRHKRATVLQGSTHKPKFSQDKTRVPSPNFGGFRHEQEDLCNGQDVDGGDRNSPVGRLDTWSSNRWKERSKSVSHSKHHNHRGDRGSSGNATIPPPLDVLKKRTSVSGDPHCDPMKKRHSSTGSLQDLKADSVSDLTSPKALDSGALFGASLGFLGSSGSLNEIHAKM